MRLSRNLAPVLVLAVATACTKPLSPSEAAYSTLHGESGINTGKSFADIITGFRAIAQTQAQLAQVIEYGTSTQGKKLTLMKIKDPSVRPNGKRPAVLISEGIHGNEYLNIADRLPGEFLNKSAPSSGFRQFLAKGGVIYIVPILNPDGYDSRQRENAAGQDLNRDFSIKAAGNNGFTQPETKSISDFMARESQAESFTLEASMEYHCCIGGLIHPWAYTANPLPPDALQRHRAVGDKVQAIFGYRAGTVREIVGYDAVGGSDDYYFETYGRRAFSFEGAEGQEQQNLPKHVEFWNQMFSLVLAEYPNVPSTSPPANNVPPPVAPMPPPAGNVTPAVAPPPSTPAAPTVPPAAKPSLNNSVIDPKAGGGGAKPAGNFTVNGNTIGIQDLMLTLPSGWMLHQDAYTDGVLIVGFARGDSDYIRFYVRRGPAIPMAQIFTFGGAERPEQIGGRTWRRLDGSKGQLQVSGFMTEYQGYTYYGFARGMSPTATVQQFLGALK